MKMRRLQIFTCAAIYALLAVPCAAQGGQQQSVGFGQIKRWFNVSELVSAHPNLQKDGRIRGVAAHRNGLLYVSGRNDGPHSSDPLVYIVDPDTITVMGFFPVPEPAGSTTWGALDMDVDLAGNILAGTTEGVVAFDIAGNQVREITGSAGPIPMPLDASGDSVLGNQNGALDQIDQGGTREFEAMAFDPNGDGGNGSVFVAQGLDRGDFLELRIADASVLRTFQPLPDANGLAIDPIDGQLWVNSSFDSNPGDVIVQLDLNGSVDPDMDGIWELLETGNTLPKLRKDGGGSLGRTYGGIDFMSGGDAVQSPFFGASAWDMVQISQDNEGSSGDDLLAITRVHQFPGVHGLRESELRGSVGANPIGNLFPILYSAQDTLNWAVASNGRPNSLQPAAIVLNFGVDAKSGGMSTLPNGLVFPELAAINLFSNPAPVIGELLQSTAVDVTTSVTLPASFPVTTGDVIRMQAVYFEPTSQFLGGLGASNELWFTAVRIEEVLIEMDSPNPLANLANPAFRMTELTGDPAKSITKIIWDVGATNSQLPGDNWFDSDETLISGIFGAGNGTVPGCTGTYRGSDVASGLNYTGTDIMNWPSNKMACADALRALDMQGNPIDPMSGFRGSDWAGGNLLHPRIVEFNFMPGMFVGMTFGFDTDLDGTLNGRGLRDYAGTWVRVERADGSTFEGLLLADSDPNHPNRALIGF